MRQCPPRVCGFGKRGPIGIGGFLRRVLQQDGTPIPGLFAAGVDVGGIANGGYASGLAQALVLGLVAAESALAG